MIKPNEMPKPEALIEYPGGMVGAAMFHFTPGECSGDLYCAIAAEHGFQIEGVHMSEDHPLYPEYAEGSGEVVGKWEPNVPAGWQLGGKHDTDDGPYAYFLRPLD